MKSSAKPGTMGEEVRQERRLDTSTGVEGVTLETLQLHPPWEFFFVFVDIKPKRI